MADADRQKYLEAYYDNEADANKQMSLANAAAAIYMLVIWILYLSNRFVTHSDTTKILINIFFPIGILVLLSPLLYVFKFKKQLRKPNYKYFVLYSFVFVITVLNTILPKHSAIAWALCILMTNHYYNPKAGLVVFIAVIVASLGAMFGGMFVGEFDANLLFGNEVLGSIETKGFVANGPAGRLKMLNDLYAMGKGFFDLDYNRYLGSVVYYFMPRTVILALVFLVSRALNKRTYKLLLSEINVNSEQSKTRTELEVAKEIQLATLPSEIVTSKDIRIIAELKAAKEIGGDFYDYFNIDEDHVGIVIGDVSGKGIPAAMFMMKTITCFKNFTRLGKKPSEIMKEVNRSIHERNESQMFVTSFFGILNKKTGEFDFANAGHNPPIIGHNHNFHYLNCNPGFVLGGLEEAFVVDEKVVLNNGDSITLYTDGVTEARNKKGELFGETRLINFYNSKDFNSLVEMHHGLKDELASFVQDAEQSDDITMLTLMYHGDDYDSLEKRFDGKIEQIPAMLDTLKQFCEDYNLDKEFEKNLLVVGDELFSNIVNHGYQNKGGVVFIRLLFNKVKKEFVLTIIDRAPAFNQLEVNNNPLDGDADKQAIGGLGILIVKTIMSEYAYDRINNKNILVLRKRF